MLRLNKTVLVSLLVALCTLSLAGNVFAAGGSRPTAGLQLVCDPVYDPFCEDEYEAAPSEYDLILAGSSTALASGERGCTDVFFASDSIRFRGSLSFAGVLNKGPKAMVFWAPTPSSPVSRILFTRLAKTPSGFDFMLNRANGFNANFPGLFQFCIRNPGANAQTINVSPITVTP